MGLIYKLFIPGTAWMNESPVKQLRCGCQVSEDSRRAREPVRCPKMRARRRELGPFSRMSVMSHGALPASGFLTTQIAPEAILLDGPREIRVVKRAGPSSGGGHSNPASTPLPIRAPSFRDHLSGGSSRNHAGGGGGPIPAKQGFLSRTIQKPLVLRRHEVCRESY